LIANENNPRGVEARLQFKVGSSVLI